MRAWWAALDIEAFAARILAYLLAGALCVGFGWHLRGDHQEVKALKTEVAQAKGVNDEHKANDQIAVKVATQQTQTASNNGEGRRVVIRYITKYVPSPGESPVDAPAPVFTRGFVRLWNDALQGKRPSTGDGTCLSVAASENPDCLASDLTADALFSNASRNFEQYKDCRGQLNGLLDALHVPVSNDSLKDESDAGSAD